MLKYVVREIVPGSGKDWFSDDVVERTRWLKANVPEGDFYIEWGGMRSDVMFVRFARMDDALAYCLRWKIVYEEDKEL